jgi:hypothetical protein
MDSLEKLNAAVTLIEEARGLPVLFTEARYLKF